MRPLGFGEIPVSGFQILPAVVVEHRGPVSAVRRGYYLTRGARLRSGGVVLLAFVTALLPGVAVMLLTGQFAAVLDGQPVQASTLAAVLQQLAGVVVGAFTTPFIAAVITALYYDRRVRVEALDVELAALRIPESVPVSA